MVPQTGDETASRPFQEFARHYDRFMNHYVDYRGWVDYVARIFGKFRVEPSTILDVACGTGIPSLLLARRGYRVVGVDRSEEMLEVLRRKAEGLPVTTLRADITDFSIEEPADAAISLYDSINYLLEEDDLARCFACVRRALKPGGVFAFDMNTVYSLSVFWGTRVTPRNVGNISSTWENSYDEEKRISTLKLSFWEPEPGGAGFVRFDEEHRERGYTRHEVKRSLKAAGFGRVWFYTHGGFLPVGPLTVRMMVVAR